MCNWIGGLKKGGGWEVKVGGGLGCGELGTDGRGSWGQGRELGSQIVTPPPPLPISDSHRFSSCRPLLHFSRFASNRPRIKLSQIIMYPTHFSTPPTTLHSPLPHLQHTSLHISPALPHTSSLNSPTPHTLFHTSSYTYPLLPQTLTLLKNCLLLCSTKNKLRSAQVPKFGRLLVKIDSSASIP